MSSSSAGSLVLGIVGGIVGFVIGGPVGALYGFSLGAVAGGLLFPPEQQKGDIRPDELQFTNSTEAQSLPVIFGTVRLPGNHIGFDPGSFKAIEQFEEAEGGKGGGGSEVSTGFLYRLTYDVGLCMGEVEALVDVQGSPGEDSVILDRSRITLQGVYTLNAGANTITRIAGDSFDDFIVGQDIILSGTQSNDGEYRITNQSSGSISVTPGKLKSNEISVSIDIRAVTFVASELFSGGAIVKNFSGDADLQDGGTVIIYPGTMDQANPTGDSFRGVTFARFSNFQMGRSSTPRSYLFTLQRFPKCRNSSGDIIAGIATRAGADSSVPEYEDANPAAVIWEIMTQGFEDGSTIEAQWGKAMSPDKMNQEDFEAASDYYLANRIGVSTSLGNGSDSISQLLSKFRDLFGLWVWWDGEQVRCRVFWDRDSAYSPRTRITDEDVLSDIGFMRSSQTATVNEVRLEFSNRRNNFQKEAITRQDLGHIETVGAVRSESFESKEVGTRRAADLLAGRLLRSLAYPLAKCQFSVHRNFAHLQPGDFVELVWNTWRSGPVTSFWRVLSIQDEETSDNSVKLTLEEDQFATARDGEISDFTLPIVSVDVDAPLDDGDFDLIFYAAASEIGSIEPILAQELPIWVSKRSRRLATAIQRRNGGIQSISVGYSESPFSSYSTLGVTASFAITGTLDGALGVGPKIIRNTRAGDHFDLVLSLDSDETEFLAASGAVGDETDSFSLLTAGFTAILVVGTEIIRLGLAEEDTPGVYTVKNAIRGEFGTEIESHADGAPFHFFPVFDRGIHSIEADDLPRDIATKLRVQAFTGNSSSDEVILDGPDAGNSFAGRSVKPMTPALYSVTRAGLDWTIKVRPRIHDGGADFGPNLEAELSAIEATLGSLIFRIETSDGDSVLLSEFFASGSKVDGDLDVTKAFFTPSDGSDPETGLVEFNLSFVTNPASVDVTPVFSDGLAGSPLNVIQPI